MRLLCRLIRAVRSAMCESQIADEPPIRARGGRVVCSGGYARDRHSPR